MKIKKDRIMNKFTAWEYDYTKRVLLLERTYITVNICPEVLNENLFKTKKLSEKKSFSSRLIGKNKRDVWNIKTKPNKTIHSAVFPEELVKICLDAGCPKNGIVLDPFAGSGTVGKVAKKMNYDYILIEINENYLTEF